MLGVRRAGIAAALERLERDGAVRKRPGAVEIVDRTLIDKGPASAIGSSRSIGVRSISPQSDTRRSAARERAAEAVLVQATRLPDVESTLSCRSGRYSICSRRLKPFDEHQRVGRHRADARRRACQAAFDPRKAGHELVS